MTCVTEGVHGLAGFDLTEAEQLDCDADPIRFIQQNIFLLSPPDSSRVLPGVGLADFDPKRHNERWMMESTNKDVSIK